MDVLVFASQKGGSGKTTLAGHIAVEAERRGDGPVALIDTDPQGSLAQWWNVREATAPAFVRTESNDLKNDLRILEEHGFKLAIIDTPPSQSAMIDSVVSVADKVIIPTRPSPHDLRAAGATVRLCETHQIRPLFVVNGATPRTRITTEAVIALSHHGAVAPVIIHHRVDFAASMTDGRTVMEIPGPSRSPEEIENLWAFMRATLRGETYMPLTANGSYKEKRLPLGQFGHDAQQELWKVA
jgi:chromosome partitioning protein